MLCVFRKGRDDRPDELAHALDRGVDRAQAVGFGADVAFDATNGALYVGTYGGYIVGYQFGEPPRPPQAKRVGTPQGPAVLVTAAGTCSVTVGGNDAAAGTCAPGGGETVTCTFDGAPEETLGLGDHAVVVNATSASGLGASCTSFVRVVEQDPPVLGLAPQPTVLWPPDHRMAPIDVGLTVMDACDPAPVLACTVWSTEPQLGAAADVAWDGATLSLRAERSGEGPGRSYAIVCTATDASGNSTSASGSVLVPPDATGVR